MTERFVKQIPKVNANTPSLSDIKTSSQWLCLLLVLFMFQSFMTSTHNFCCALIASIINKPNLHYKTVHLQPKVFIMNGMMHFPQVYI